MKSIPFTECVDLVGSRCKPFKGTKKYVSTGAVDVDQINEAGIEIIDYEKRPSRANLEASLGDVLFAKMQGTKKTLLISSSLVENIYSTGFCAVKAKENVLTERCLYHLLTSKMFLEQKDKNCSGATQKAITNKGLQKVILHVPDINKQDLIAAQLDLIVKIITLRKQELVELDDLIKARFVELFGDPTENQNGYQINQLSDYIISLTSGSRGWAKYCVDDGNEWFITIKNVKDCRITTDNMQPIKAPDNAEAKRTKVKEGDLLISITADLGRTGVVTKKIAEHGAYINQHLSCIRLDREVLNPIFVAHYMESPAGKEQFIAKNQSAVKAGLNFNSIKSLKLMIPPMEKQKEFEHFVAQIDKSKSHAPHLPIPSLKWYPLSKNEVPIMEEKIIAITNEMAEVLNIAQLKKLQEVLVKAFSTEEPERKPTNHKYLRLFLEAKSIEGCSPRTLQYYEVTVQHLFAAVNLPVRKMTTERMREYLSDYQQRRNCSKATIDNIRRNISSFFSWLEEEDHILKSPMRRIHKIKTKKTVKEVISDEDIEKLRDSCTNLRDLAMIDLLYSTGIRVGELVRLNIEDVNFESRECVVFGKGDKERRVYFDAKTKIHLKNYLESRRDTNRALFVSLLAPYNRLAISGVEIRLRKMGRMLNLKSIHPHKFRRTMATRAIDKGMPIEQVQKILGHSQIDTTMQYAIVNQNNVKMSHQKYIA